MLRTRFFPTDFSPAVFTARMAVIGMCLSAVLIGCAGFDNQDPLGLMASRSGPPASVSGEYRQKFQVDRSPSAFNWLLAHQIENGMTVAAVSEALGESGERYLNDREMKTDGGAYQSTDDGYKWGPDTNGRSVILFFREGKLINFDPDEFE